MSISLKQRQLLDISVLAAAKERIRDIIHSFDSVIVAFSGGKDSLVALILVEEIYSELNIPGKINVIFRDEEFIPEDVINFVQEIYLSGKYNFRYFCLQLESEKYILGNKYKYIQWDKNRDHIRDIPEFAITDWTKTYNQYTSDPKILDGFKGKKCIITGLRSDESLTRYKSIINKKNKPHIAATRFPDIYMGRVIYDFTEKDIFRFLYERKIKYCSIYDAQIFNNDSLRVATPLHAEAAKRLNKVKTLYPLFYDQMISIFPEIEVQSRYYKDLDRHSIIEKYDHSHRGILKYIEENIDVSMRDLAKMRVLEVMKTRRNNMRLFPDRNNFGGYPLLYVFKAIISGNFKRRILPMKDPTQPMIEYEKKNNY